MTDDSLLAAIRRIADDAGALILGYYAGAVAVRAKADASPVTEADEAAEALILAALEALGLNIPIVAEEKAARGGVPGDAGSRFWLVDPLDGTKEFLSKNGEFTVNIALIENRRPVLGVVYAPAIGVTYLGGPKGASRAVGGGEAVPLRAARPSPAGLVAVVSRSHRSPETDAYLARFPIRSERSAGSSLKFGLVAAGEADLYPRLGRTMEWDTAAGHAVVAAAGGSVRTLAGDDLLYGKPGFENPSFVVRGREG